MKARFAIAVGFLCLVFVSGFARAQDAGTCSPACQPGEICVGTACMVPACRPPCGAGETCVGGTCMVPAAPPPVVAPPPVAAPPVTAPPASVPPVPAVRPATPEAALPTPPPTVRNGAYVIAQVGVSAFLEDEARYLSPGLRVAAQAGGYLTNDISLGGSLTFDLLNWDLPPGNDASGFMLEAAFAPLYHVGDARAEFVVGPALGGWLSSLDASDILGGKASGSAQGWALGGNVGLLVPVRSKVRVGGIFNFMFRDTLHACTTTGVGPSRCSSTGTAHQVIGFSIAAML